MGKQKKKQVSSKGREKVKAVEQLTLKSFFGLKPPQPVESVVLQNKVEHTMVRQTVIDTTNNDQKSNVPKSVILPIGTRIQKPFPPEGELFDGEIIAYDKTVMWYKVRYDDGDEEDLEPSEVLQYVVSDDDNGVVIPSKRKRKSAIVSHKTSPPDRKRIKSVTLKKETPKAKDDSIATTQLSPSRRQHRRVCAQRMRYVIDDTDDDGGDDDFLSESEDTSPPVKTKQKPEVKRSATMPKVKVTDSSSDFEGMDDSDEESLDTGGVDEVDEVDEVDDDLELTAPKGKPKRKATKSTTAKKASKTNLVTKEEAPEKKKMSDSFEPKNYPDYQKLSLQQIKEQKGFLDPCGMEATDGIIDRLVGEQVDKIGGLLQRALQQDLGSISQALKLGTACSGTDAPALALTLVKEQMEFRNMQPLNFTHEFSCEVDPFKQAYLARNFDSILYPDISKLTDDPPRDVYGQEKPIPSFNLFVAGTSCKNFSMLRSNKRLDIEDRGCSGETFMAATELLFKEKPKWAIFENVEGAPWEKMSEYITGRVKLSECDKSKAIKNNKDKNKGLTFVKETNGDIVVDYVPAVYGIRCGAIVDGFLQGSSTKLRQIEWPSTSKKSISLEELMRKNSISKANDTLVFKTDVTYCTQTCKMDTKDYGLPQTRNRTYMFVWQPDNDDFSDDLGVYWKAIVEFLKSPVRHSLPSFVLNVDHEIIRIFREGLNGPAGRQTKQANFLEPDFWTSASANLPHNVNTRARLGLNDMARFTTSWGAHGQKQIPPHFWLEYMNCNNQRILDLIDILHASAARDAETHDSYFSSFYWNISQNATKEKHRTATPGIAGCVTPGGDFFVPSEGRPLLGCEKLLLQGIPYFRLALGNETEVQLGDLAGNAMSLTVVCATMMAAMTCTQLRKEARRTETTSDLVQYLDKTCVLESYSKSCKWNGTISALNNQGCLPCLTEEDRFFRDLAALAKEAVESSVCCTCETSGSMSTSTSFLECSICRVSCCRNCTGTTAGYNLCGHEMVEVELSNEKHGSCDMQMKLRNIAPSTLRFNEEGIREIAALRDDDMRVTGLDSLVFQLHRLKRGRKVWELIYYARDNNGVGENMAEFKISVGEMGRKEKRRAIFGVVAELKSFMPARTEPLLFGSVEACAMYTLPAGETHSQGYWMGKSAEDVAELRIAGSGLSDSNRVDVGLNDNAESSLREHVSKSRIQKDFDAARKRREERRWIYAKNWKLWPQTITIDGVPQRENVTDIAGTYLRSRCRRTMNQGALWVRSATDDSPSLFILLRPNVLRTGPDSGIVSSSLNHDDMTAVIAEFPFNWEPCDALDPKKHNVELTFRHYSPISRLKCLIPTSNLNVTSKGEGKDVLVALHGFSEMEVQMFRRGTDTSGKVKLNMTNGIQAQQTVRVFNAVCVAPILKHAAIEGLKLDASPHAKWERIVPSNASVPFGTCKSTLPDRPTETWFFNEERKAWDRSSEPGASRAYYLRLQAAPKPFEVWLDTNTKAMEVKFFPEVVAHSAAGHLISGRGGIEVKDELKVYYRLSDVSQQTDPVTTAFKVRNCDYFDATAVSLKPPYQLYERQMKVVTKMLAIEERKTTFEELEMSEFEMPGSTGFSLAAKATRQSTVCGGVIADAIGAGKTVISIALILKDIKNARHQRGMPNNSGATLVAVPPGLIDQWHSEIKKFSESLDVVKVYDHSSMSKVSVEAMIRADIVIVNIDILQADGYLENLLKKAGLGHEVKHLPGLPQYAGQIEQTQARGVWIPSSSNDPYGGANNPNNQKRRNHTAFYTTLYNKGVQALREKSFKESDRGVPLEFFEYHRIIVDEVHESLCTTRNELKCEKETAEKESSSFYKEKNRRAARELLGITQKDIKKRPLICRRAIFGLTGTPLLDSSSRVIELANLMGGTYVIGLSSHWRKLERESCRDIFLHNYLEPRQSREVRKNINIKCQDFLDTACTRNKADEEMEGITLDDRRNVVRMSQPEKLAYLDSQSGISAANKSLSIKPEDFDPTAGHDISKFLRQNANLSCRGKELVSICKNILKNDPTTKIVVFADGRIGAGIAARDFLKESGLGCTWLDSQDSVQVKNKKIAWYQSSDATREDCERPRVLVLHFAHAAGLNLQSECYNLILFTPLYVGEGGASGDPVSDTSTELQAIGRVYRPGQTHPKVYLHRIEVQGPEGEECLDGMLIRRNTDEETKSMAINSGE